MDTILFAGVGLFFIYLGLMLNHKHKKFVANSIEIDGRIVSIIDRVNRTRGNFGQVTDINTIKAPLVQYRYGLLYEFEAELDTSTHDLGVGSSVVVLIDPLRPKTAKLQLAATQSTWMFKIMIGLGTFACILGAIQYKPIHFDLSFFEHPFMLIFICIVAFTFYTKVLPTLRLLKYAPIYQDNAREVIE